MSVCVFLSGLSRCVFCLPDCKLRAKSGLGINPEQLKQFNQQADCWCRIYHINIIYKISVQSNTQGWKGLSCPSSIPEDSFKGETCSRNRMFDQIKRLWGNPERVSKVGWKTTQTPKKRSQRNIISLWLVYKMRFWQHGGVYEVILIQD